VIFFFRNIYFSVKQTSSSAIKLFVYKKKLTTCTSDVDLFFPCCSFPILSVLIWPLFISGNQIHNFSRLVIGRLRYIKTFPIHITDSIAKQNEAELSQHYLYWYFHKEQHHVDFVLHIIWDTVIT